MQYASVATILALAAGSYAQEGSCRGSVFNQYCCENGEFSGPVVSAFESSLSSDLSGISTSIAADGSSLAASLSSQFAGTRTEGAQLVKRVITTEVTSGLTCIGDAVSTLPGGPFNGSGSDSSTTADDSTSIPMSTTSVIQGTTSTGDGTTATVSKSTSTGVPANTASTSTGGAAAMLTHGPILAVGGAAMAFAYGAM